MKIVWNIEPEDISKVKKLVDSSLSNPLVEQRIQRNLKDDKAQIGIVEFWHKMVVCLLTTQQRSGPSSPVTQFAITEPFPLNHKLCSMQQDLQSFVFTTLTEFGGIRRTNKISEEIFANYSSLEEYLWGDTSGTLDALISDQDIQKERGAAEFIDDHFKGFGPKQSRNLLQMLGLTKYEIPIDSRITKWLNAFGFPVKLTANALSDRNYYNFVMDGIQELCTQSNLYPCVLDAAIFASFDGDQWTEETAKV